MLLQTCSEVLLEPIRTQPDVVSGTERNGTLPYFEITALSSANGNGL
jgi:hypothetical protein